MGEGAERVREEIGAGEESREECAAPERIGPYKILNVLGEGGFGVVYLAEQTEPVRRRVALKVIKPGMDSRAVISRFEAERQALAMMDHPNVARVLDAGTTERGLPYFVMDHVAGVPITAYCERADLQLRQKLDLFMQVCGAVQHAHQKGVMHRDIKPSNILVEYVDGRAVPKVIDFGVAKALSQPLTDQPVQTHLGQFIGTPEYMSPEQAEGTALDVDTRSDVYSLGVVLYELLTGMLPFDGEKLRQSGQSEMIRTIREEEPVRPSSRIGAHLSDPGTGITPERRSAVRATAGRLRGDLDWIVMRCLEKDRSRRYGTPNGLAMDIRRYLAHEPVLAGPPSATYRLGKFVKRNRAGVSAAVVVAVALMLGMVGTTLGFLNAEEARRAEAGQRETAEKMYAFMSEQFITAVSPEEMGGDVTMRELMHEAAPQIGRHFTGRPVAEAGVRMTFGATYMKLGAYTEALEQFRQAYDLRREALGDLNADTLEATDGMGHAMLSLRQYVEAEPLLQETLEARRRVLGETHERTLDTLTKVAAVRYFQGDLPGAIDLTRRVHELRRDGSGPDHEESIRAASSLAELLRQLGQSVRGSEDPDAAAPHFEEAESLLVECLRLSTEHHGERAPITLSVMNNLAGFYASQGDDERSVPLMERALLLRREVLLDSHPDTLRTLVNLAGAYRRGGRDADAAVVMIEVLSAARARGATSRNARRAMRMLGSILLGLERHDEALDWLVVTVEACDTSGVGESLEGAIARRLLAGALHALGRAEECERELVRAYGIVVAARGEGDGIAHQIAAQMVGVLGELGRGEEELAWWRGRAGTE